MASPIIRVQAAFGSNPTDASYTWTTIHEDGLRAGVRQMSYSRGRQNELNRMETGTGNLLIRDPESDWDSDNTSSVYYPNVRPYVPVRAVAVLDGVTYPLFLHYLERKPRTRRIMDSYTERSVTTVDGFEWLSRAGIASDTYAQALAGTRIGAVLDSASWPAALRDIDAGNDTVAALTVAASDDAKALTHILDVVDTENGLVFMDAQGRVQFVERHALVKTPYTVSQVTFRDATSGGGGYPFVDSVPVDDLDTTFNEWSGTRSGGVTQTATDATSKTRYGPRTKQVTSLATADTVVANQMQWKLGQFKDPLSRLESITVMPGDDSGFWAAVLGLEIGERVTVRETPPGWPLVKQTDYSVQSVRADFSPGSSSIARFTFGLWPAGTTAFWSAGDAANSLAGQSTRAAY